MLISVPSLKIEKVLVIISELLISFEKAQPVKCKFLAKLCGLLCHMLESHGNIVRICSRNLQHFLGLNTLITWEGSAVLTSDCERELILCQTIIPKFNGSPIHPIQGVLKVFQPHNKEYILSNLSPSDFDRPLSVFFSDSSDRQSFVFRAGICNFTSDYYFDDSEAAQSSGFRELLAVAKSYEYFPNYFKSQQGSCIAWITDSTCLYSWLLKGSRIPMIQKILLDIKTFELQHNISFHPLWVPRSDVNLQLADDGSKALDSTAEFGISHEYFINVQDYFNVKFTIDGFARFNNRKCHRFFAPFPQKEALGVNFFFQNLSSSEIYYLHPGPNLIHATIEKLSHFTDITAILITPMWISRPFWSAFLNCNMFKSFIAGYYIMNPLYISSSKSSMFKGFQKFKTIAFLIKTDKVYSLPCPDWASINVN